MSNFTLSADEYLTIELRGALAFQARASDVFRDLIECTALANQG